MLLFKLFRCHLRMSGSSGMNYQTLHVGYIGKKGKYLERVNEFPCLLHTALDFKCKDGTASVREIFLIQCVVRMLRKRRVIYFCDLRMMRKEANYFQCIFHMAFHSK